MSMAASSATDVPVWSYHEYRAIWMQMLHEVLPTIHKRSNLYDRYAMAARKYLLGTRVESTVGHLLRNIYTYTFYNATRSDNHCENLKYTILGRL